jgi:IclR family KDG regulon transcriptional repressor
MKARDIQELEQKEGRYNIRAVDRAVRILSVLSDGKPRTLTELSEEIAINSSTTFRLLATLAYNNYVERDGQSGAYRPGLACLELARAYHESNDIRQAALPALEMLRDDTKETVHLAVLDKMEVVYVEKLHGLHAIGLMSSRVGGRSPAYCTGVGKVLLAYIPRELVRAHFEQAGLHRYSDATVQSLDELMDHLENVRRQGYALDRGEHEAEVRCVAAPIFDMTGKAVAAISVSGPAGRMEPLETNLELINQTQQTARSISARLGYREGGHNAEQFQLRTEEGEMNAQDHQPTRESA